MAESNKNDSSLNVADTKLRLNREEQTLNNAPENNTVFVEVRTIIQKAAFHDSISEPKYCLVIYTMTCSFMPEVGNLST